MKEKNVELFDWKGTSHSLKSWANVLLEIGPVKQPVACLVVSDVSYDMSVSRPLMKALKINLHFYDRITYATPFSVAENRGFEKLLPAEKR